ncbi:MAG TPA: hypothetical protein VGB87_04155 [Vicinamibacteria bacterium]
MPSALVRAQRAMPVVVAALGLLGAAPEEPPVFSAHWLRLRARQAGRLTAELVYS